MIEKKSPLGTIVDQNVYVGRDSLDNKLTTRKEVKNLIEDIAANTCPTYTYNGPTYTLLASSSTNGTYTISNSLSNYDEIEIRLQVTAFDYDGGGTANSRTDYAYDIKSICSTSLTYSQPPIGPSNFYYHTYRKGIQAIAKTNTGTETYVTVYKNSVDGTKIVFIFSGSGTGTCSVYGKN